MDLASKLSTFSLCVALACFASILHADDPPGVVISQSPDPQLQYLNSPALTILADGTYIASHGWRFPKENRYATEIFASKDKGESWMHLSSIDQIWTNVFEAQGDLFAIGVTKPWGQVTIRRSTDNGTSWTEPTNPSNGVLSGPRQHHSPTDPMPIIDGRIWRSVGVARDGITAQVMSAPVHSRNLLDAKSWTFSEGYNLPMDYFGGTRDRLFHGSLLPGPSGNLVLMMRVEAAGSRAAIIDVSKDGSRVTADLNKAFIHFPGGLTGRFIVRYDEKTKRYWTIVNKDSEPYARWNRIALMSSEDLRKWKTETMLFQHFDSKYHGLVKLHWQFAGNDLVGVAETMWAMGHGNVLTFHRFENFRDLTLQDSAPMLGQVIPIKADTKSLSIVGNNFEIAPFSNNQRVFGNWNYTLQNVPAPFKDWSFTRIHAGSDCELQVTAKRGTPVYFAIGLNDGIADVSGWTPLNETFTFSGTRSQPMSIFRTVLSKGEQLKIPSGTWTGGMILIPDE